MSEHNEATQSPGDAAEQPLWKQPWIWSVVFIALLALLYGLGLGEEVEEDTGQLPDTVLLAIEFIREEGPDPSVATATLDGPRLLETLRSSSDVIERASAAFNLARLGEAKATPILTEGMLDEEAMPYYRLTCVISLALAVSTRDEVQMRQLVERYESLAGADEVAPCVKRGLLCASYILAERDVPTAGWLAKKFAGRSDALAQQAKELFARQRGRQRQRAERGRLDRQRHQYYALPVVIILGTLGAGFSPALLLLLPLIAYPFNLKVGAFFLLSFHTVATFELDWAFNLIVATGVAYLGVEYLQSTPLWADVTFLSIVFLANMRLPLRVLAGQTPRKVTEVLLADLAKDSASRKMALATFARRGPELIPHILAIMSKGDERTQVGCIEALGCVDNDWVFEPLRKALEGENRHKKMAAAVAIARFQRPEALATLKTMALDDDFDVRSCALRAIGTYPTKEAKNILFSFLQDRDQRIQALVKGLYYGH